MEVERTLAPLRALPPPLSDATFEAALTQLRTDIAAQHNARENREQAQHADREAREDRRDAQQTFEGRYGQPKLEEVLRLLDLQSEDDLPETLRDLAKNKKKSEDTAVLQNAIDARASAPASAADENTKPQLSTHIIDKFRSYAWAATGNDIADGITPFNITFVTEPAARTLAAKVERLTAVESSSTSMSYADAEIFLKNDAHFPVDSPSCAYRLAAHSIMVDIMMGPTCPYAVAYRQCVQALQSHLLLSLRLQYGDAGGGAYHLSLRILYWLTQQFLYYLSQRKLGRDPPLPDFDALLRHAHTKTLDGFLGQLPASWMEQVTPTETPTTSKKKEAAKTSGSSAKANNTNWNVSIKKRWEAAHLQSIKELLGNKQEGTDAPIPKFGDSEACLSWLIRGRCFTNCSRASTHKQAGPQVVEQTHALFDACGVPASN